MLTAQKLATIEQYMKLKAISFWSGFWMLGQGEAYVSKGDLGAGSVYSERLERLALPTLS